jgi:hypothetical protein
MFFFFLVYHGIKEPSSYRYFLIHGVQLEGVATNLAFHPPAASAFPHKMTKYALSFIILLYGKWKAALMIKKS